MSNMISEALDDLLDYVYQSKPMLFSSDKVTVSKDAIEEYIEDIRNKIPTAITEGQKVVENRDKMIESAKKEIATAMQNADQKGKSIVTESTKQAQRIIKEAESKAAAMVEETEIVKMAKSRSTEIEKEANAYADKIKASAMEYATSLLEDLEKKLKEANQQTNDVYGIAIKTFKDTKEALKNAKNGVT